MLARVTSPVQPQAMPDAPFHVLHLQQEAKSSGSFRPDARLVLAPALRTTGFWTGLDPQDAHTLILLLSFLSPNGHAVAALSQVADALHCSPIQARTRLLRLSHREWRGQSLAVLLPRDDGNDAFAPGPSLLAQEHVPPSQENSQEPLTHRAGREAVLAHSRTRYAKPRAEVEAGIAERMGWGPPTFEGDTPDVAERKQDLFQKMTTVGVTREQALDVLTRFPAEDVEKQITWLPLRNAKSPARFLLAAIEGDYDPPVALKQQEHTTPLRPAWAPPPDLPGIAEEVFAEDVFDVEAHTARQEGDHSPLLDPDRSADPPDEPAMRDSTLYQAE